MVATTATLTAIRRLLAAGVIAVSLAVAGCGSSSPTTSAPANSAPASTAPASAPASTSSSSASGIPQGPTAGDRDSDNNGGPSDGDGNV